MQDSEYTAAALRTEHTPQILTKVDTETNLDRLLHGSIGLATEAGELQDAVKRDLIYGQPLDRVNVIEECGDVLWYLVLILTAVGSTLEEAKARNIAKLRKRYPEKFTEAQALNRDYTEERQALEGDA